MLLPHIMQIYVLDVGNIFLGTSLVAAYIVLAVHLEGTDLLGLNDCYLFCRGFLSILNSDEVLVLWVIALHKDGILAAAATVWFEAVPAVPGIAEAHCPLEEVHALVLIELVIELVDEAPDGVASQVAAVEASLQQVPQFVNV